MTTVLCNLTACKHNEKSAANNVSGVCAMRVINLVNTSAEGLWCTFYEEQEDGDRNGY